VQQETFFNFTGGSKSTVQALCAHQSILKAESDEDLFSSTFPPSGRQLNEYAFHIARELKRNPDVELTILADELTDYDFATDENGNSLKGINSRSCQDST
jgi:hypothetical protein